MDPTREHLRLLSIFHFVLGGLGFLVSLFPGIYLAFGILMLVIWLRSAFSVLGDDENVAFKVVHLVLAAISIGFGLILSRLGFRTIND